VIARTWSRRVELRTSDAAVYHAIRYLECDPEIEAAPAETLSISIEPHRTYYRIVLDGTLIREQLSPQGVTESLHAELMLLSLKDFPAAPLIHAASLRHRGRRILLVGPKGGGKTVLTLHLIKAGYDVEGDENVFITKDGIYPRPRALRVKQSALPLLPHLGAALRDAPFYGTQPGTRIYNLDPRRAGAPYWRIEGGSVDAVILVRPNHGGFSSIRPVISLTLVREVITECAFRSTGRAEGIAAISQVIGQARGFDLSLGDIDGALDCLGRASADLPEAVAAKPHSPEMAFDAQIHP
jgi:hypothetical protein